MQTQPATIAEAFAAWSSMLAAEIEAQSEDQANAISLERTQIERVALTLPAVTARDVWQLVAMTTDRPHIFPGEKVVTEEQMILRAHDEVSTTPASAPTLAVIFDRWLAAMEQANGPTGTDADFARAADLADLAALAPVVDPLDVWRKVAIAFDVTSYRHAGPAAAIMAEARTALGVAPTLH